jgi:site-specific DNA recombinase
MCWQLAANNNWNVTNVFSDEGQSSETLDRPQLTQLIAAIEAGRFRFVIVYSIDRLTRRLLHFQYLLEVFAKHRVKIAVVNGPSYSDDANGRLMANIVAAVSEFQQEMTRERMSDMRAAYKRRGKRVAGRVPFGYRSDPVTKQLVVDEEQGRAVRDFFALAESGSRPSDIAGLANLKRWPDQNGQTGKWTARRILKLLNNRVYLGEIPNGESTLPGEHQSIVKESQFHAVQSALAGRRTSVSKRLAKSDPGSQPYANLTSKLICGQCNRPMSTSISHKGSTRYIYYRCRSNAGGQPRCVGVNIGVFSLEQFVASVLADVDDPESEIPMAMREHWQKQDERERQKEVSQVIHRVIYTHSTGEVTIELKPDVSPEFSSNDAPTGSDQPDLGALN